MYRPLILAVLISTLTVCCPSRAVAETEVGSLGIKMCGPIAFTPDGVLFIGDPQTATIFAVETNDVSGTADQVMLNIEGVNTKIAALLGTVAEEVSINDVAVNPASGNVYFSVSLGRGPAAVPMVMTADSTGALSEFSLQDVSFSQISLPNPAEDKIRGEGRRRRNSRRESITDLAYLDGKLFIAGLSNEEFASKLHSIRFPFESIGNGTSVEIFHGAHGKYETRSPVRTLAAYEIDSDPHLLAAYTCTPLVKFPIAMIESDEKILGTTVAELGNRNRPLDMIIYQKDGQDFVLMANSSRGLMRISVDGIADIEGITERVRGTAGLSYDTLAEFEGVVQLDRLDKEHAVILVQTDSGGQNLNTIELP